MSDYAVSFEEEQDSNLYMKIRVRLELNDSPPRTETQVVKSVAELEQRIERMYRHIEQKTWTIISNTMMGKPFEELEPGDIVELRTTGNVYTTHYVNRTTKYHIFLLGEEHTKYRRTTGECVGREEYRWLIRYDQQHIDEREKAKTWRKKINLIQKVRWISVQEEDLEIIYTLLVEKKIITE